MKINKLNTFKSVLPCFADKLLPTRLDGAKEQCNVFCPPGPPTESKGAESPFCYVLACLHFDCDRQLAQCCENNFQ